MITELRVEGFKSFGTPEQILPLGQLNFVVGANASGKTNLLTALRFLQNAVLQNAEFAVNDLGGLAEVRNKIMREREQPKPVKISLVMNFPNKDIGFSAAKRHELRFLSFKYAVTLDLRSGKGTPEVVSENLIAEIEDQKKQTLEYRLKRNKREVEISDPTERQAAQLHKFDVPEQEATRLALGVGFFSPPCVMLRHIMANWRFYNISTQVARMPAKEVPEVDLGFAGENLAVILHNIERHNGKGALASIIASLQNTVAGFKGLRTVQLPIEGSWAFQILEEKIKGAINPNSVSDGTIRLLALLIIANWSSRNASLICIEEPENGIHPHLSEHLAQIFREAAQHRQFLITTHNPSFLDYLNAEEIVLCDKIDGFTQVRRASDIPEIKSFQKHFRLGELWVQGALGGIP